MKSHPKRGVCGLLERPTAVFPRRNKYPLLLMAGPSVFCCTTFFRCKSGSEDGVTDRFCDDFSAVVFSRFRLCSTGRLIDLLFCLTLSRIFECFSCKHGVILLATAPRPTYRTTLTLLRGRKMGVGRMSKRDSRDCRVPSRASISLRVHGCVSGSGLVVRVVGRITGQLRDRPSRCKTIVLSSGSALGHVTSRLEGGLNSRCFKEVVNGAPGRRHRSTTRGRIVLTADAISINFGFRERVRSRQRGLS